MIKQTYTLRMLCLYIRVFCNPIRIHVYLLFYVFIINYGKHHTMIQKWIQNYSAKSCLNFEYKIKDTTESLKINALKRV
jgi:hypothetical protein